jgi:hypothetical protein
MKPRSALPLLVMLLMAAGPAVAAPSERPTVKAVRIARPPGIDGKLEEAVWQKVPVTDSFTQKFPRESAAPEEKTRMRVAYDDEAVYVGIECEQRLAPVVSRLTRRDRVIEADWVSVTIDTRSDGKSAFDFTVNAAGVLVDTIRFDDNNSSAEWDENWDARTTVTESGWSAEFRLPLRILRFSTLPVQSWGFQVRRYVSHRQEIDEWAFIPRSSAAEVSMYGRLDDLRDVRPGTHLELSPFVVGRYRRRDARPELLASGSDVSGSAGIDLKWHPSQELTLDAALLPDFAQVEADQVVLNLTSFETNHPEKRRFFQEGIDTFTSPEVQLLYTRRIGRAPPPLELGLGERLVDVPEPATIIGALKLTGHLGPSWEVGMLSALAASNEVEVQLPDGSRQRRVVDPLAAYSALRIKRGVGDNGHVGFTGTSVVRAHPAGAIRETNAHVGSLDWRWRSPAGDYTTVGQLSASLLQGGAPRLMPDGTRIQSGDVGTSSRLVLAKDGGQHWLWEIWGAADGRKLETNDLGYLDRAGQFGGGGSLTYRTLERWRGIIETSTELSPIYLSNYDRLPVWRALELESKVRLTSFWSLGAELQWRPTRFEDREVGDGTALERPGATGLSVEIESDPRAAVSARLAGWVERSRGHTLRGEADVLFRVLPALDLEVMPRVLSSKDEPRYAVTTEAGTHVFGRLRASSADVTLRATYTFTPRLTLQAYAQLFLAARHYTALSTAGPAGARAVVHLADLRPLGEPLAENPDSEEAALNTNVVLRWEFRSGCVLHLVYTRAQAPTVDLERDQRARLRVGSVRRAPAADVVLLKIGYWWG